MARRHLLRTGVAGRWPRTRVPFDAPDEVLLAAMAQGDEEAVTAFVHRYEHRVYGLAFTMLGDRGLAEDVAQEAFVRAWHHAGTFDPRRAAAPSWLLTIARNLAIDRIRVRRPVPVGDDDLAGLLEAVPADEHAGRDGPALWAALGALPAEQRRAVVLAAAYGYTAAEIGVREAIPLGTAKSRIRAGLAKLRAALEASEERS